MRCKRQVNIIRLSKSIDIHRLKNIHALMKPAHHQIDVFTQHRTALHHELLVAEIALYVILKEVTESDTRGDIQDSISIGGSN